jgi:hypothetical protein
MQKGKKEIDKAKDLIRDKISYQVEEERVVQSMIEADLHGNFDKNMSLT